MLRLKNPPVQKVNQRVQEKSWMLWNRKKSSTRNTTGLEKGLEQGQNRLALLVGRLLEAGQMDDLKRVSYDEDYRAKLLKEFGL